MAKTAKKKDDGELHPKVHRRILEFLNRARAPGDLLEVPPNFHAEVLPPGRDRPFIHDPEPAHRRPLLDHKHAAHLLEERARISPIYGFRHLDDLVRAIPEAVLRRLIDILRTHFSGATFGQWTTHGDVAIGGATIVPRHAALLHTGEVLMIEGKCSSGKSRTWLWDSNTKAMVTPAPALPGEPYFNLYCAGHTFLRDGRLLAYGGGGESNTPGPKNGAWIFDPDTRTWDFTRDVSTNARTWGKEQRWYPTLVTLGDHRVLVASGDLGHLSCSVTAGSPMQMEIYDEATGRFEYVTTPSDKYFRPTYPGLNLLPDNTVFFTPVGFRNNSELAGACTGNEPSSLLTLSGLNGTWNDMAAQDRTKGMSVLLLSNTSPYVRVMAIGGGDSTTAKTYAFADLSSTAPSWGSDLSLPLRSGQTEPTQRIHPNVVLLADGTVFVAGGAPASEPCWLYDPATASWAEMDELTYQRRYHSFALLLPTGEVMACGGQGTAGQSTIEVFQPPYLFNGARPTISNVTPDPIHHGQSFVIETPDAASIARVTMVRPMAVTHQTDSEQRVIELNWGAGPTANSLSATGPSPTHPHGTAQRGWYMLFLINTAGVPSVARFVYLH